MNPSWAPRFQAARETAPEPAPAEQQRRRRTAAERLAAAEEEAARLREQIQQEQAQQAERAYRIADARTDLNNALDAFAEAPFSDARVLRNKLSAFIHSTR